MSLNIENIPKQYLADYEISLELDDLKELRLQLTEAEQEQLEELKKVTEEKESPTSFFQDLMECVKTGSLQFIDSMTDTVESFDHAKNPENVNKWDDEVVKRKWSTPEEKLRTLRQAQNNPFKGDILGTSAMSESGRRKFQKHIEAYSQRSKSITGITTEENTVSRKIGSQDNSESLSGLRGYRFGPVVALDSPKELKEKYDYACKSEGRDVLKHRDWLRKDVNFPKMYKRIQEEYGFDSYSDAEKFCRQNHLTVHEGPDGLYLVPTDVHDMAPHSGYKAQAKKFLEDESTESEFSQWSNSEKIYAFKHEAKTRAVRAVKGIGLSVVKDTLKLVIATIVRESYNTFTTNNKDSILNKFKHILSSVWEKIKNRIKNAFSEIWSGIKGSLISELLTLINDFIFRTVKNIFKVLRMMWKSLVQAVKIIFNNQYSWKERIFEASKIVTAGFVGVVGFALNEMIEKLLISIGIPFASFISEVLSGFFGSIMSAIVLMLFDKAKNKLFKESLYKKKSLIVHKQANIVRAGMEVDILTCEVGMQECINTFAHSLLNIGQDRSEYYNYRNASIQLSSEIADTTHDFIVSKNLSELKNRFKNL